MLVELLLELRFIKKSTVFAHDIQIFQLGFLMMYQKIASPVSSKKHL